MSPSTGPSWHGSGVSAISPVQLLGMVIDGLVSNRGPNDRRTCPCVAPTSQTPAHTRTLASNINVGDHHIQRSDARPDTSLRMAATSRVDNIDSGSTSPTRPPGRVNRIANARNSAAVSAYGPPPNLDRPPRDVADDSWLRKGGLPTTASNCRSPQSVDSESPSVHDVFGSTSIPVTVASSANGSRNRPSPQAGSKIVRGANPRRTSLTTASTSAGGVYHAPRSFRCDTGIVRA